MLAVMLACGTHIGESLAFGAPPVLLVGALVVITMRERRRERLEGPDGSQVGTPAELA